MKVVVTCHLAAVEAFFQRGDNLDTPCRRLLACYNSCNTHTRARRGPRFLGLGLGFAGMAATEPSLPAPVFLHAACEGERERGGGQWQQVRERQRYAHAHGRIARCEYNGRAIGALHRKPRPGSAGSHP